QLEADAAPRPKVAGDRVALGWPQGEFRAPLRNRSMKSVSDPRPRIEPGHHRATFYRFKFEQRRRTLREAERYCCCTTLFSDSQPRCTPQFQKSELTEPTQRLSPSGRRAWRPTP